MPESLSSSKLRRQIAWEAARLMYDRRESEYYRAKMKAARWICRGWVKPIDLPSNAEIRDEIQALADACTNVRLTGAISKEDLATHARAADLLIFSHGGDHSSSKSFRTGTSPDNDSLTCHQRPPAISNAS